MSRMVRALGSVCAGRPKVRSGAGHLGVEVDRHVLLLLAQRRLHVLLQAQARGDGRVQPEPERPDISLCVATINNSTD
jgi:hypothetical protein